MMKTILRAGLAAAIAVTGFCASVRAADISGAGATFPYPIYAKWADAYKKETGIGLNYQSIGSGGGIKQIKAKTVDFGASDMPLKAEELEKRRPRAVPDGDRRRRAGRQHQGHQAGRAEARRRRRSPTSILGKITKWNDPAIAALNPGVKLPAPGDRRRPPLGRLGHDFIFTNYLSKVEPGVEGQGRRQHLGRMAGRRRRQGQRGRRRQRRAAPRARSATSNTPTPSRTRWPTPKLQNKDGKFVSPERQAFQAAAASADWDNAPGFYLHPDRPARRRELADHRRDLHPDAQDSRRTSGRRSEALKFFDWAYKNGDKMAEELDYVPMPDRRGRSWSRQTGRRDQGRERQAGLHVRLSVFDREGALGSTWIAAMRHDSRLHDSSTGQVAEWTVLAVQTP